MGSITQLKRRAGVVKFLQFLFLSSSNEDHQLFAKSWPVRSPAPGPGGMLRRKKNALLFGFPANYKIQVELVSDLVCLLTNQEDF